MKTGKGLAIFGSLSATILGCGASFVAALIFMGIFGGVGTAIAPSFHFGLVEGMICQEDSTIEIREFQDTYESSDSSFETTGVSTIINCVSPDGSRQDRTLQAVGWVLGLYFGACFIPLALVSLFAPALFTRFLRRMKKEEAHG